MGGERQEREGCGLQIKYTSILLPSNLVVLVGTFLCQICRLSFFFSFWVESAHRNEITHRPRILRDQITIWQGEAEPDRGKAQQARQANGAFEQLHTHTHTRSDEFAIGVHLLFPLIPRVFMNLLPYVPFQFFCFVYKYSFL